MLTLCSRCGEYQECVPMRAIGPPDHALVEACFTFEVCSQKCLEEVYKLKEQEFGPFKIARYTDTR